METQLLVGVFHCCCRGLHVEERLRASWAMATVVGGGGGFTSKGRRRLKPTGNQRASGGRHRAGVPSRSSSPSPSASSSNSSSSCTSACVFVCCRGEPFYFYLLPTLASPSPPPASHCISRFFFFSAPRHGSVIATERGSSPSQPASIAGSVCNIFHWFKACYTAGTSIKVSVCSKAFL